MRFIISFIIVSFVTDICWTESSKENKIDHKENLIKTVTTSGSNIEADLALRPQLKSLWVHNPMASTQLESDSVDQWSRHVSYRKPHTITKLAKILKQDNDPLHAKSIFEPFEKRSKPITLVAFRKHSLVERITLLPTITVEMKTMQQAELQSPYNHVSAFWQDAVF